MNLNLEDKVVVISGGAGKKGSIGLSMVKVIAEEGAKVAIVDMNDRGNTYVKKLRKKGCDALFVKTDVSDPQQVQSAIEKIVKKYKSIDVVINNVGVNDGVGLDADYESFLQSLKLNLVSYWLMVKYALPHLKKSQGNILNIGSKVALTGQGGTSGYAASKGGVLALTREWAVDLLKFKIRSNAIIIAESWTPSYDNWIKTLHDGEEKLKSIVDKIPLENRMTTPHEIANTAAFLISDKSSHTTGQFVFVDGGYVHLDRALLTES